MSLELDCASTQPTPRVSLGEPRRVEGEGRSECAGAPAPRAAESRARASALSCRTQRRAQSPRSCLPWHNWRSVEGRTPCIPGCRVSRGPAHGSKRRGQHRRRARRIGRGRVAARTEQVMPKSPPRAMRKMMGSLHDAGSYMLLLRGLLNSFMAAIVLLAMLVGGSSILAQPLTAGPKRLFRSRRLVKLHLLQVCL
jgi:hypothetical protein